MNSYDGNTLEGETHRTPAPAHGSLVAPVALALAIVALAFGCGGRVEPGDGESETSSGGSSSGGQSTAASSTGGASKPGSPFGSTELAQCHPGFDPDAEPTRRCVWIAKGLCYDTKLAACACICPRNRQDSVCSSGFEDDLADKTLVTCY